MRIQHGNEWQEVSELTVTTGLLESWPEAIQIASWSLDWPDGTHIREIENVSDFDDNGDWLAKRVYRFNNDDRRGFYLLEYLGFDDGGHTHAKTWRLSEHKQ